MIKTHEKNINVISIQLQQETKKRSVIVEFKREKSQPSLSFCSLAQPTDFNTVCHCVCTRTIKYVTENQISKYYDRGASEKKTNQKTRRRKKNQKHNK